MLTCTHSTHTNERAPASEWPGTACVAGERNSRVDRQAENEDPQQAEDLQYTVAREDLFRSGPAALFEDQRVAQERGQDRDDRQLVEVVAGIDQVAALEGPHAVAHQRPAARQRQHEAEKAF